MFSDQLRGIYVIQKDNDTKFLSSLKNFFWIHSRTSPYMNPPNNTARRFSLFSSVLILLSLISCGEGIQVYSEWVASSAIARGQGNGLDSSGKPTDSYEHGAFQRALTHLYEKTANKTYLNYIQAGLDNIITSSGSIQGYKASDYTLDNLRIGESIVQL